MHGLVNLRNRLVMPVFVFALNFFNVFQSSDIYSCWQVIKLKEEIETQNKKKEALETRASIAEKKIQELTLKLESVSFGPSTKFATSRFEFRTSDFSLKIQ